jgi:hypothetical protein
MDLLIVARETSGTPPTPTEVEDPLKIRTLLGGLPHGAILAQLVNRAALGVLVLANGLDRTNSRAAIRVSMQRARAKAAVLLGHELGRELLGEGLPLAGGIREIDRLPVGALGQAKAPDLEHILADICQRAGIPWAPPSARAAPMRTLVRAEEAEASAALLIERQRWAEAVETLHQGEPLGPRGTNMLGRALLAQGDRDGARAAFERTLAADPGNAIAQRQLASLG